ncbi:GntR family transcriptional regulator [Propionimicrobium sp. PCR01-08-3]|uniref:GntR family transcriptional regulator n=1 Tax=Propionimicrobium sp. PCR01-08-3 TaxID=3052086 RepID=UPI00255CBF8A|nr:GntR family transcriptional regulator [Propionimicrobium sp. PCR01-08-3]WIY82848.1 GntR family transcriptional regulator [Propionimicrobium sp. PCR01-08-3]
MAQPKVRTLQRKVLRDTVYESLVSMLMSGSLAPETPLSIDGLAAELGVSPTPVREALVHMERTGLVTRAPLRGYRVAPPLTPDQIGQLCDTRLILEPGALILAFKRVDELGPALAKAHTKHEKSAKAVAGIVPDKTTMNAYRDYMDADWAFHNTIFRFTDNVYLQNTADQLPAHLHRLRQSVRRGINDSELAVSEHAAVLAAVEAHDLETARQALYDHISNVKDRSLRDESDPAA